MNVVAHGDRPMSTFDPEAWLAEHMRLAQRWAIAAKDDDAIANDTTHHALKDHARALLNRLAPRDEVSAFEAWMAKEYPGVDLSRRTGGDYWSTAPDAFWEGWFARSKLGPS